MSKVSKSNVRLKANGSIKDTNEKLKPVKSTPNATKTATTTAKMANDDVIKVRKKLIKENSVTKVVQSEAKGAKKPETTSKSTTSKSQHSKTAVAAKDTIKSKAVAKVVRTATDNTQPTGVQKIASKVKPQLNAQSTSKSTVQTKSTRTIKADGTPAAGTKAAPKRQTPLKASHTVAVTSTLAHSSVSSKNVMNQVHNVTVCSPPPVRREIDATSTIEEQSDHVSTAVNISRDRTRTRTLGENEILLLKPKQNREDLTSSQSINKTLAVELPAQHTEIEIKQPISFEVVFDEKSTNKPIALPKAVAKQFDGDDEKSSSGEDAYEDDFESYESDFETDLSSDVKSSQKYEEIGTTDDELSSSSKSSISIGHSDLEDENVISTSSKHPFEMRRSIENSEFDSGSFELKVLSARTHANEAETIKGLKLIEAQNDSGIENNSNTFGANALNPSNGHLSSLDLNNKTFDNISDIEIEATSSLDANNNNNNKNNSSNNQSKKSSAKAKAVSKMYQRGKELLHKITLDTMNYVLFDFKPIPYEVFMKIYGNSNTAQVSIQTHNNLVDQDNQSDSIPMRTVWTQYPPVFYTRHISQANFSNYKNGCGTASATNTERQPSMQQTFSNCLNLIEKFATKSISIGDDQHEVKGHETYRIDYNHLHRFLQECELTLSRIIDAKHNDTQKQLQKSALPFSEGYFTINIASYAIFQRMQTYNVFSTHSLANFFFTLHKDTETHLNLIALWNLANLTAPVCLLSIWSPVLCVEVHLNIRNIVFAGLDDGSLAVWDYSESKYWHPSIRNSCKRFVPSQIVSPVPDGNSAQDIGRCVSIRSLYMNIDAELLNGYNPKQLCTLHECGLLILWTILTTAANTFNDLTAKRIDHQSMWSKVKLVQNKVIDLRLSIRQMVRSPSTRPTSSSFDKTRSYFESELFSDTALQELHEINRVETKHVTNFSCTAIELTRDSILIATNENFLLFGRRSFKSDTFRRLQIDSNRSVHAECMIALSGYEDDTVLVALNTGIVKSFCHDRNVRQSDASLMVGYGEEVSLSSASSLTPIFPAQSTPMVLNAFTQSATSSTVGVSVHDAPSLTTSGNVFRTGSASAGKSCTIQSIVQSERKIYDEIQAINNLDNNEFKMPSGQQHDGVESLRVTSKYSNFVNGQTIMGGSLDLFSKASGHLVQLVKSKKLIVLDHHRLRVNDLAKQETMEVDVSDAIAGELIGLATTVGDHDVEYLILLGTNNTINVHHIKVHSNLD